MTKEDIIILIKKHAKALEQNQEITDDIGLFKDLKYDSLSFIEFIAEVEECIGKEFDDMSGLFERLDNVGELCSLILQKAAEAE